VNYTSPQVSVIQNEGALKCRNERNTAISLSQRLCLLTCQHLQIRWIALAPLFSGRNNQIFTRLDAALICVYDTKLYTGKHMVLDILVGNRNGAIVCSHTQATRVNNAVRLCHCQLDASYGSRRRRRRTRL
jgi:hypothetical protein